jgi:hypothetical protein
MGVPFKLSTSEEGVALDYLACVHPVISYRKNYPNSKVSDAHAKGKIKEILKRERVKAYIEQTKANESISEQCTEDFIKKYLVQTMLDGKNTRVGLDAALALGKEFGIGTNNITIKEERAYDIMLLQLHEYNDAKSRGEQARLPDCLSGKESVIDEIEFEIVEEDVDDS